MSGALFVGAGITLEQEISFETFCLTAESSAIQFLEAQGHKRLIRWGRLNFMRHETG
jgi:hypothetical protein